MPESRPSLTIWTSGLASVVQANYNETAKSYVNTRRDGYVSDAPLDLWTTGLRVGADLELLESRKRHEFRKRKQARTASGGFA